MRTRPSILKFLSVSWIAAALALHSVFAAEPQGVCLHEASQALQEITQAHFDDENVYQCNLCFINSGELGRVIAAKAGHSVDLNKLNILVIRHKEARFDTQEIVNDISHTVVARRGHTRNGDRDPWRYHAVLEYEGNILDLDRIKGWELTPFRTYLRQMLPFSKAYLNGTTPDAPKRTEFGVFNDPNDLRISEIPVGEYLRRFPAARPIDIENIDLKFVEALPKLTVEQFVKKHQPEAHSAKVKEAHQNSNSLMSSPAR